MEKKKYYYARYSGIDKYDMSYMSYIFYIFDTKETIYVKQIINLSGKKFKDNDLVCIEKDEVLEFQTAKICNAEQYNVFIKETHKVLLDESTIDANARFYKAEAI